MATKTKRILKAGSRLSSFNAVWLSFLALVGAVFSAGF